MRGMAKKVADIYKYYSDKRYSTIAGTLVYFLLMSITPFIVWLTLILGRVDIERLLPFYAFESIKPFIDYLKSSAESAVGGAGFVFLVTALYSSTNFFYHLRRSGEIIYGSRKVKGGVKLRIISVFLILGVIILSALFAAVTFTSSLVLNYFMPEIISEIIYIIFATAISLAAAILLNLFACPYKLKVAEALGGSLLTTILWLIFFAGFGIYLQFANPEKLYGAIASVFVFLLWCYLMMCGFVIGMIYNGKFKEKRIIKTLF